MTFVVGASAHGSPGVSTALQLVASQWPTSPNVPVVLEADPSGGVLAARYEISLTPGLVTLAESLRKFEAPPLLDHAQRLPSGVACLPISPSASAASAQLRSSAGYLGPYLRDSGHPVLLDAGTLLPDSRIANAVRSAEQLLWFVRPTREELLVLRYRLAECPQPDDVGIVLVGDTPYGPEQVEEALEVPVLHVIPIDARGANAANLGGDDRFLRRSPLARSCGRLAEVLRERMWHAMMRDDDDTGTHTLSDLAPKAAAATDGAPAESHAATLPPPPPPPSATTPVTDDDAPGEPQVWRAPVEAVADVEPLVDDDGAPVVVEPGAEAGEPQVWRAPVEPVDEVEPLVDDDGAPVVVEPGAEAGEPQVWRAPVEPVDEVEPLVVDDGAPVVVEPEPAAPKVWRPDDSAVVDVRTVGHDDLARDELAEHELAQDDVADKSLLEPSVTRPSDVVVWTSD